MSSETTNDTWNVKRAFVWTRDYLTRQGDEQARLSTEWLLAEACHLSRIEVYTQFDRPLSSEERSRLRDMVRRRGAGEPLQYIVGEVGFRHIDVKVRPGVLIPRPETEVLVDLALAALPAPQEGVVLQVLDLCTGTGCIGLSLAHERPDTQVTATDVSPQSVTLAEENAEALNLLSRFRVIQADLFESIETSHHKELREDSYDLIVTNPPYIPCGAGGMDALPQEVADFEPSLALDGGEDGLVLARRIIEQASDYLKKSTQLICELDVRNVHAAEEFAVSLNTYKSARIESDLTGRKRFLLLEKAV